jgi:hypothetical protein
VSDLRKSAQSADEKCPQIWQIDAGFCNRRATVCSRSGGVMMARRPGNLRHCDNVRIENCDPVKALKVGVVERQDVGESVTLHRGHKPCVMGLLALDLVLESQSLPDVKYSSFISKHWKQHLPLADQRVDRCDG